MAAQAPISLYQYQQAAVDKLLTLRLRGGVFLEMGTGKTRTSLAACQQAGAWRILVVSPLSAVGVWHREIANVWPALAVYDATRANTIARRAATAVEARERSRNRFPTCLVVGYESYWRKPLREAVQAFDPHVIIYDEAHRLKNRTTRQAKYAHLLSNAVPCVLALTGTPMPNGIQDLFSIMKAVNPKVFGPRWADFDRNYLIRGGFGQFKIVGYQRIDEVKAKLRANAVRVTKAQALDLPEQVDVEVPVTLSPKARTYYDKLRDDAIAEIEGFQGSGVALSRVAITNILRLQQVTSGFVKTVDDTVLDFATDKLDVLRDLLDDVLQQSGRAVVFARFIHDVDAIQAMLSTTYPKVPNYRIDGRVSQGDRERQLEWFKTFDTGVLVGQVAVASLGIDLTCAHVGVFYAPDYSLTNYLQSRDRLHRHGQTVKVTYYHLAATHTIDGKIYAALANKRDVMRDVLDKPGAKALLGA